MEPEPESPEPEPGAGAPPPSPPPAEPGEARGAHLRRQARSARLYTTAFLFVAMLVVLIALVIANTRRVEISWVIGTSEASLVWIIVAAAILGWLLGIATGAVFRLRTRRR